MCPPRNGAPTVRLPRRFKDGSRVGTKPIFCGVRAPGAGQTSRVLSDLFSGTFIALFAPWKPFRTIERPYESPTSVLTHVAVLK